MRCALLWSIFSCLGVQLASKVCFGVPVVSLLGYQLAKLLGEKNKDTNVLSFQEHVTELNYFRNVWKED